MQGNGLALLRSRGDGNVVGRFVPRSARCILIAPTTTGWGLFFGRCERNRNDQSMSLFNVANSISAASEDTPSLSSTRVL
jgi:hypothetical protein